jgi:hypothetical protein
MGTETVQNVRRRTTNVVLPPIQSSGASGALGCPEACGQDGNSLAEVTADQ